jgi:multidrug transporter EmrE-like cation transporter
MKTITFYSLAAAFYVVGGVLMKYSEGLTKVLPAMALVIFFSAGALMQAWAMKHEALGSSYVVVLGLEALLAVVAGSLIFAEQVNVRILSGVALVVLGICVLRLP